MSSARSIGQDDDALSSLKRTKRIATAVLAASVLLFLSARALSGRWPAFAYVAAFAEAATIGGLADWYAVVALFRRPLGLPFPHTAIIPRNRDRIADRLGRFIQDNFLRDDVIDQRLKGIDFVGHALNWLRDPRNASAIAERLVQLAPTILAAIERSGLRDKLGARVVQKLATVDTSRAVSAVLRSPLVSANRQRLLDVALDGVIRLLSSPATLADLREGLRGEAPALVKLVGADNSIFRKIVMAIATFVDEVRNDPDHRVRSEFDAMLDSLLRDIESSPETQAKLAGIRDALLSSPEVAQLGETLWTALRAFVEAQPQSVAQSLASDLTEGVMRAASAFDLTEAERARINDEIRTLATQAVSNRREDIGTFVSAQVRSWDTDEMVRLAEANIGTDLQYIRLNGALVGGLAGLAIYTITRAFG